MAAAYTTLIGYVLLAVMQYVFVLIVHKGRVFNIPYILALSAALVGCSLLCLLLYRNIFVRYAVIAIMLVAAVFLRKNIVSLLRQMKRKGDAD